MRLTRQRSTAIESGLWVKACEPPRSQVPRYSTSVSVADRRDKGFTIIEEHLVLRQATQRRQRRLRHRLDGHGDSRSYRHEEQ